MIKNFASKVTEDIYHGISNRHSRRVPEELHGKVCRLLDQLNAATKVETLRIPPGNNLERLRGKLVDYWSIRVNKKWRIMFKWHNNYAYDVELVDYH